MANWAELQQLATQINKSTEMDNWPLTDDWNECKACAYQAYCGRQGAGTAVPELDEAEEPIIIDEQLLTPELP